VSRPASTVIDTSDRHPYPFCNTTTAANLRPWLGHLAGGLAAARGVLRGVITLAEHAPELSDEQLRSRLVTLGGLVR
jgi:hypothetical protein